MYRNFYGFSKYPFCNTPDTEFFFESEHHLEALSSLIYTISEKKGFAAIAGEIGSGKTTISRKLINQLGQDVEVGLIANTCLREEDFLKAICEEFRLDTAGKNESDLLSGLNEFLLKNLSENRNVVLIIDEAQNLSLSTLEKVRMLSNLETEKEKLIQIILLGQSELQDLLSKPEVEQLRQRIHLWFHLNPFKRTETIDYIHYRLQKAQNPVKDLFPANALNEVFEYSKGVPRIINNICDNALLLGYVRGFKKVSAEMIGDVAKDLGLSKREAVDSEKDVEEELKVEKAEKSPVAAGTPKKRKSSFYSTSPALVFASLIVVMGIVQLFSKEETASKPAPEVKQQAQAVLNVPVPAAQPAVHKEKVKKQPQKSAAEQMKVAEFIQKSLMVKRRLTLNLVPTESQLD